MNETSARNSLRDITREAVRSRIAEAAVALFERDGFDAVTVGQIASDVGISARSFHRYFPAKEDAVVGSPERYRSALEEAFKARPADEPLWESLREAFVGMVNRSAEDPEHGRRSVRVMKTSPSLRARNLEKHLSYVDTLVPFIIERLEMTSSDDVELRAATLAQAALSCFDVAIARWSMTDEDAPVLLRRTFDMLRTTP